MEHTRYFIEEPTGDIYLMTLTSWALGQIALRPAVNNWYSHLSVDQLYAGLEPGATLIKIRVMPSQDLTLL